MDFHSKCLGGNLALRAFVRTIRVKVANKVRPKTIEVGGISKSFPNRPDSPNRKTAR